MADQEKQCGVLQQLQQVSDEKLALVNAASHAENVLELDQMGWDLGLTSSADAVGEPHHHCRHIDHLRGKSS